MGDPFSERLVPRPTIIIILVLIDDDDRAIHGAFLSAHWP
jgi:hypothetical protein